MILETFEQQIENLCDYFDGYRMNDNQKKFYFKTLRHIPDSQFQEICNEIQMQKRGTKTNFPSGYEPLFRRDAFARAGGSPIVLWNLFVV